MPAGPLNVVDSSAWIEYLTEGANAGSFASAIENTEDLLVPSLSILEVCKWVAAARDEAAALQVAALMRAARVIELDADLALEAARLGRGHRLALADSVIYATTRTLDATLWTQDADFADLPQVRFIPKHHSQ